jgi:hypothetical protein
LEGIVNGSERPVILAGEDEMDEEDGGEGEGYSDEKELDGQRAGETWLDGEDGIVGEAGRVWR